MMIIVHFKGRNINLHEPAARVAQNSPKYATYSSCHQPYDPMPLSCNHPHNILSPTFRVVRDWPLTTQIVAILLCWRHPSILTLGNVLFQYDFFLHVLTLARCKSFNLEITLTSGEEERLLRDWRDGCIQFMEIILITRWDGTSPCQLRANCGDSAEMKRLCTFGRRCRRTRRENKKKSYSVSMETRGAT